MKPPVLRPALMRGFPLALLGLLSVAAAQTILTGTVKEQSEDTDEALISLPWQSGAGQVEGRIASSAGVSRVIVSAAMSADGKFSLTLPATLDPSLLPPPGLSLSDMLMTPPPGATCTGAVKTSDPAARVVQLALSVKGKTKSGEIFSVLSSGHYDQAQATGFGRTQTGLLYYAERAMQLSGTQSCQWRDQGFLHKMTVSVTGQLAKGWNRLTLDTTNVSKTTQADTTFRLTGGALPTNDWTLLPDASPEEP